MAGCGNGNTAITRLCPGGLAMEQLHNRVKAQETDPEVAAKRSPAARTSPFTRSTKPPPASARSMPTPTSSWARPSTGSVPPRTSAAARSYPGAGAVYDAGTECKSQDKTADLHKTRIAELAHQLKDHVRIAEM